MTTQLQCGELLQRADKSFSGRVKLIGRLDGPLQLVPHPNKPRGGEDHPDYLVRFDGFDIGAAWIKNSDKTGDFLSLSLAHPDWNSDLYLTAYPPDRARDERNWRIVWSRPRSKRAALPAAIVEARETVAGTNAPE